VLLVDVDDGSELVTPGIGGSQARTYPPISCGHIKSRHWYANFVWDRCACLRLVKVKQMRPSPRITAG
jgi:hypothetical protein